MNAAETNLDLARRYLASVGQGDPLDNLRYFADDVVQEEFPNRLLPNGASRDLAALRDAAQRGSKVMSAQRFEILNAFASGDQVAVEALWKGTLAVACGSLPVGGQMDPERDARQRARESDLPRALRGGAILSPR